MWGKHFKFIVIRRMTVADKEDLCALSKLSLQKTLNIGDYTAGFSPTIQGVTLLQETPEHICN
jgi:hypothetical protein